MIPRELITGLNPVRRRLWIRQTINYTGLGVLGGLGAACLLLLIARFVPMLSNELWAGGLVVCGALIGVVWSWATPPSYQQAAQEVDRYGLQDRVSTALSFAEDDSKIAALQRQEAVGMLLQLRAEVPQIVKLSVPRRAAGILLVLALMMSALTIWDNPLNLVAKERQQVQKDAEKVAEEAKKALEAAKKTAALSEKDQAKLDAAKEKLLEELKEAKTKEDVERALAKAQLKVKALEDELAQREKDLAKAGASLAQSEAAKKLGEALQKKDSQAVQKALEQMKEQLSALSEEQRKSLAEALANAGGQASNQELQQAFQMAAQAMQQGDLQQMQNMLGSLENMLNGSSGTQTAGLQQLGTALAAANGTPSGVYASAGGTGQPGDSPGSSANGGQNGSTTGSGSGSQNEGGLGNGNGNGSGSGSGNGNGNGNGSGGNGSGIGGSGAGNGAGSREWVMVPAGEFGVGEQGSDGSGPLGQGSGEMISGSGQVTPGVVRPYKEVYREYADYARESVDRSSLPLNEQELVRDYFSEIAP
ncbi:hypothetical protein CIG75_11095 [Tumebacillus algifaecis]|uniref:Uncharacterized protein n=1 Tax=Tumebacillus algifaecis TaxID=1214604 RepID=A0A223D1E6_9BACL|nr:hypothetical protein [Tumebacillus algifaecis]ASS75468.1 hypothetical protein CIG75_11095 [Tumebacillus algifaecis]